MKQQILIKFVAGAAIAAGSMQAAASGFGGGWAHDSTGTLQNSNAPTYTTAATPMREIKGSGFGGGWAHDSTGTLYNADAPSYRGEGAHSGSEQTARKDAGFGGGWAHDSSGTLSYNP